MNNGYGWQKSIQPNATDVRGGWLLCLYYILGALARQHQPTKTQMGAEKQNSKKVERIKSLRTEFSSRRRETKKNSP